MKSRKNPSIIWKHMWYMSRIQLKGSVIDSRRIRKDFHGVVWKSATIVLENIAAHMTVTCSAIQI